MSTKEELEKALAAAAETSKAALRDARALVTTAAHLASRSDAQGREELLTTLQELLQALDRIRIS